MTDKLTVIILDVEQQPGERVVRTHVRWDRLALLAAVTAFWDVVATRLI